MTMKSVILGVVFLVAAPIANAGGHDYMGRVNKKVRVAPGQRIAVGGWGLLTAQCETEAAKGQVESQPSLGTVSLQVEQTVITGEERGSQGSGKCVGTKAEMMRIYYTAGQQRGVDRFSVYLYGSMGHRMYNIEADIE